MRNLVGLEMMISQQERWFELEKAVHDIYAHLREYGDALIGAKIPESQLQEYYSKYRRDNTVDKLTKKLSKVIKKRTGLTIGFPYSEHWSPYAIVYQYSLQRNDGKKISVKKYFEEINKNTSRTHSIMYKGSISFDKVKVTGDFANVTNKIFINWLDALYVKRASVQELVWILLHEIGHCFDAAYIAHIGATTSALLDTLNTTFSIEDTEQYINTLGIKVPDRKLVNRDDYKVLISSEIDANLTERVNQSFNGYSDGEEVRADTFATRFGYGVYMGTALLKYENLLTDKEIISIDKLQELAINLANIKRAKYNSIKPSILSRIKNFFFKETEILAAFKPFKSYNERLLEAKAHMLHRLDMLSSHSKEGAKEMKAHITAIKQFNKVLKSADKLTPSKYDASRYGMKNVSDVERVRYLDNIYLGLAANDLKLTVHELRLSMNKYKK